MEGGSVAGSGYEAAGGLWMVVQGRPFNGNFQFLKRNKICGGVRENSLILGEFGVGRCK